MASEADQEVQAFGRYQVNNCLNLYFVVMNRTLIYKYKHTKIMFFLLFLDDLFKQIEKEERQREQFFSRPQGKQ